MHFPFFANLYMVNWAMARASEKLPFNPRVLHWAREWAERSIQETAHHVHVDERKIAEWESADSGKVPTVRQARLLASFYGRPFLEFFRTNPPDLRKPALIPDFRLYRGADDPAQTRELREIQEWANAQRANALDLFAELSEEPPTIPEQLFSTTDANFERLSTRARELMNFPVDEQTALAGDRRKLSVLIRHKIESFGVLTLRHSGLKSIGARGFCIAVFPLPVVAFCSEAPTAQSFTLVHEFAHVLLRQSGVSGPIPRIGGPANTRRIEEWCNNFAGAFLLPQTNIQQIFPRPANPLREIADETLKEIARHFGTSEHATLIRLVHLNYVRSAFYWDVKKAAFEEEEANYRSFGRSTYYGSRYRNSLGDLYTSLVIDAWAAGRITNHNAAEFMGIKHFSHLKDIRDKFGT